jgi:hypothetical protein
MLFFSSSHISLSPSPPANTAGAMDPSTVSYEQMIAYQAGVEHSRSFEAFKRSRDEPSASLGGMEGERICPHKTFFSLVVRRNKISKSEKTFFLLEPLPGALILPSKPRRHRTVCPTPSSPHGETSSPLHHRRRLVTNRHLPSSPSNHADTPTLSPTHFLSPASAKKQQKNK